MKLSHSFKLEDWATSLVLSKDSAFCASSNGEITEFSTSKMIKLQSKKVHDSTISKLINWENDPNMLISCSNDSTVKIFDSRQGLNHPIKTLKNSRNLPFFSLDISNNGLIASGSELKQQDVELAIWDIRKLDQPCRSLIDGHNDDITEVKFHPIRSNVLLSGSTDGCVNLYDLNIVEEDDSLFQSINYTSIHSANFLNENRLFVLSHMETLSIFDLSNENDMDPDSKIKSKLNDKEIGDLREKWSCDYIVDIKAPNYVIMGSYESKSLKIAEFHNEFDSIDNIKELVGAHGEEVVRDVIIKDGIVWSAGEDSCVKIWTEDQGETPMIDSRKNFIISSEPAVVIESEPMDIEFNNLKDKDSKPKKEKKSHKEKKKSRKNRFTPY